MGSCKKEQAIRAKDLALEKMAAKDFPGAGKLAAKAQKLDPDLEDIARVILICNVHCCSGLEGIVSGEEDDERDWYKILDIDPTADEASVRRQYSRMALNLHPDKNRFPGAADAFRLVCRAKAVLTSSERRSSYDSRRNAKALEKSRNNNFGFSGFKNDNIFGFARFQDPGFAKFQDPGFAHPGPNVFKKVKLSENNKSFSFGAQEVDRHGRERKKVGSNPKEIVKREKGQNRKKKTVKESEKKGAQEDRRGTCGEKLQFLINSGASLDLKESEKEGEQVDKRGTCGVKLQFPGNYAASVDLKESEEEGAQVDKRGTCGGKLQFPGNSGASLDLKESENEGAQVDKRGSCGEKLQFPINSDASMDLKESEKEGAQVNKRGTCGAKLQFPINSDASMALKESEKEGAQVDKRGTCGGKLQFPVISGSSLDLKESEKEGAQVDKRGTYGEKLQFPINSDASMDLKESEKEGAQVDKRGTCGGKLQFPIISDASLDLKESEKEGAQVDKRGTCGAKLQFPINSDASMDLKESEKEGAQVDKRGTCGEKLQFPINSDASLNLKESEKEGAQVNKRGTCGEKLQFPINSDASLDLKESEKEGAQEDKRGTCVEKLEFQINSDASMDLKESEKEGAQADKRGTCGAKLQFPGNFAASLDLKNLEYSDSELNDFGKGREKKSFGPGQIWAIYDTLDAMPRFYAFINNVITSDDFKAHITWLEPCPDNVMEEKWLYQGLPASCGTFRLGESENIEDHAIFSHLVNWKKDINLRNIHQIYPRKGETWAIFKNWKMDWYLDPEKHNKGYEFDFVEILSDYCDGLGVHVVFLGKIKGFSALFSRTDGEEVIPAKDKLRFSHRVSSFRMTSNKGPNGTDSRSFELDPASLPENFNNSSGFS